MINRILNTMPMARIINEMAKPRVDKLLKHTNAATLSRQFREGKRAYAFDHPRFKQAVNRYLRSVQKHTKGGGTPKGAPNDGLIPCSKDVSCSDWIGETWEYYRADTPRHRSVK